VRAHFVGATLLIVAVIAALTSPAGAGTSSRGSAVLVSGTLGDYSELSVRSGTQTQTGSVDVKGVTVQSGELRVRSGGGTARAVAAARSVRLLDGLVTAYGVRRETTATTGGTTYAGRVSGLRVGGRDIGATAEPATYELPDGAGTVVVNSGPTGLVLTLDQATGDYPAGTRVMVADVSARVVKTRPKPSRTAEPTPTATPGENDAGKPAKRKGAKRKRSPEALARAAARRAARQRLMNAPFVFPVFGAATFSDDWGAPRQIGAHQGNDIFAPFGAPVVAVADGEIFKVGTLPISGNRLWIRADTGDTFFYAHLSSFAPGAVNGRRVKAGALLGFVGNTGDAEPTPPHVHFEVHPGDGRATNPFKIISVWQANPSPAARALARYGGAAEQPGALVEVRDFIAG
jgi:hypothetical protein